MRQTPDHRQDDGARLDGAHRVDRRLPADFDAWHWPLHDREAINQRRGPVSGAPMFRLIWERLTRLEFVGIVYEHREHVGLVFARSAAVIRADGTLAAQTSARL